MKKTITFLITLLSTSLIHTMRLPYNEEVFNAYIYTERPRRTANGWILKTETKYFTEYCTVSDSKNSRKYFLHMKEDNDYGYTESNNPPFEYPKPTIIHLQNKVLST